MNKKLVAGLLAASMVPTQAPIVTLANEIFIEGKQKEILSQLSDRLSSENIGGGDFR